MKDFSLNIRSIRRMANIGLGLLLGVPIIISCQTTQLSPTQFSIETNIESNDELPYIVRIQDDQGVFRGTGVVVSQEGLVMTTSRVVRYRNPIRAIYKGKLYRAATEFEDPILDVSLFRLGLDEAIPASEVPCLWRKDSIKSGDRVTIFGQEQKGGVARIPGNMISWTSFRAWPASYKEVMQVHPLNTRQIPKPGFSGGPIFNSQNHVIGLFCCSQDLSNHFYDGIPITKIINRLEGHYLLEEICVASNERIGPLAGFEYNQDRLASR